MRLVDFYLPTLVQKYNLIFKKIKLIFCPTFCSKVAHCHLETEKNKLYRDIVNDLSWYIITIPCCKLIKFKILFCLTNTQFVIIATEDSINKKQKHLKLVLIS